MRGTILAASLAIATTAHARPTIVVEDAVPFTARDLADAVEIRVRDSSASIHIARAGDLIVITVGDRARVVQLDNAQPRDLARVVALVIVSLAEAPAPVAPTPPTPPTPPSPPSPPSPPDAPEPPDLEVPPLLPSIHATPPARPPSRFALRTSIGYQRTDGGVYTSPFLASLVTSVSPNVRFVVSAGLDEHGTLKETSRSVLGRLGVEGRFGALGIELGGAGFAFRTCAGDTGTANGFYGTARVYLPVSHRTQLVVEAGGYYVNTDHVSCDTTMTDHPITMNTSARERFDEYAGHIGIGVEWAL